MKIYHKFMQISLLVMMVKTYLSRLRFESKMQGFYVLIYFVNVCVCIIFLLVLVDLGWVKDKASVLFKKTMLHKSFWRHLLIKNGYLTFGQ